MSDAVTGNAHLLGFAAAVTRSGALRGLLSASVLAASAFLLACHPSAQPGSTPGTTGNAPASRPVPKVSGATAVTLVVEGDSNSVAATLRGVKAEQRWPSVVEAELEAVDASHTYTLDNRARDGWSTGHALAGLDTTGFDEGTVYLIMMGTNDVLAWQSVADPPYPYTAAESEANLRSIITQVRATGARVILISPPVAVQSQDGDAERTDWSGKHSTAIDYPGTGHFSRGRSRRLLMQYAAMIDSLGAEYGLPVVRVWDNFAALGWDGSENTYTPYLYDGIHLSAEGNALVAKWVTSAVSSELD